MMKDWKSFLHGLPPHLLAWIWAALLISQMILAFFVFQEHKIQALRVAGWVTWDLGTVFAILPIFTLLCQGQGARGQELYGDHRPR